MHLVGEPVVANTGSTGDRVVPAVGIVYSLQPKENTAIVEFEGKVRRAYKLNELIFLNPQSVIMQGLVSNWDQNNDDFLTVMKVYKLVRDKRKADALLLGLTNETTKFFCLTDGGTLLKMQMKKNKRKRPKL